MKNQYTKRKIGGYMVENITMVKGTDGPTAVFLAGKNHRYTLRQKIKKYIFNRKMKFVEKSLKPEWHTVDEVIYYVKNKYGFEEADKDSDEYKEEYNQMRSSFIIQYKPELLGDLTSEPELKGTSEQDMLEFMEQNAKRMERAQNVPKDLFDIDYHKLIKRFNDKNDYMHIDIEKNYSSISGGVCGSDKMAKKFNCIYKDIYRYYGVSARDIMEKTERYEDVVHTLSM